MTTVSVFKLESFSKTELLDPQHNHQLPALLVSLMDNLPIINNRREIIIKEENTRVSYLLLLLCLLIIIIIIFWWALFLASIYTQNSYPRIHTTIKVNITPPMQANTKPAPKTYTPIGIYCHAAILKLLQWKYMQHYVAIATSVFYKVIQPGHHLISSYVMPQQSLHEVQICY